MKSSVLPLSGCSLGYAHYHPGITLILAGLFFGYFFPRPYPALKLITAACSFVFDSIHGHRLLHSLLQSNSGNFKDMLPKVSFWNLFWPPKDLFLPVSFHFFLQTSRSAVYSAFISSECQSLPSGLSLQPQFLRTPLGLRLSIPCC